MILFLTLHDPVDVVIALCWLVFVLVWVVSALFVKRTVERSTGWARLLVWVAVIVLFTRVSHIPGLRQPMWPRTAALSALAALVTVAGLIVCVWARTVLGRNWSGTIAFKEGHELIERGPYAYVRHPIYSGFLLMGLGTAIGSARLESFLLLATAAVALGIKARFEEQFMSRHFPEAYPQYRRRVKALIPGVW
jgi:protein-S-isoprenylcysteine O-methyltransferase Ste14